MKSSSFKYNGTPVTRTKAVCETPFGVFRVGQGVNGRWFMFYPYMSKIKVENEILPQISFARQMPCNNLEYGIKILEEKWAQFVNQVNEV